MTLMLKIFKAGMLPALALALMLSLVCGRSEAAGKALVVYFSWSGNTEAIAQEPRELQRDRRPGTRRAARERAPRAEAGEG